MGKESKVSEILVSQAASQETRESSDVKEPFRRRLPDERQALTHHFSVGGQEGYLTVGLYADGVPGEIFITMSKEGSTVSGLMDCFATAVSLALQYGVPLKVLCQKFSHTRFEQSGYAKSLMDYMFRWLALKFLPKETLPSEDATMTEGIATADAAVLHSGQARLADVSRNSSAAEA